MPCPQCPLHRSPGAPCVSVPAVPPLQGAKGQILRHVWEWGQRPGQGRLSMGSVQFNAAARLAVLGIGFHLLPLLPKRACRALYAVRSPRPADSICASRAATCTTQHEGRPVVAGGHQAPGMAPPVDTPVAPPPHAPSNSTLDDLAHSAHRTAAQHSQNHTQQTAQTCISRCIASMGRPPSSSRVCTASPSAMAACSARRMRCKGEAPGRAAPDPAAAAAAAAALPLGGPQGGGPCAAGMPPRCRSASSCRP